MKKNELDYTVCFKVSKEDFEAIKKISQKLKQDRKSIKEARVTVSDLFRKEIKKLITSFGSSV